MLEIRSSDGILLATYESNKKINEKQKPDKKLSSKKTLSPIKIPEVKEENNRLRKKSMKNIIK